MTELLATKDDMAVVRPHADFIRAAVRPLMKRSFTRRVVIAAYNLAAARPKLPADPGVRPEVSYPPIDESRYIACDISGFRGSGAQPVVLRDQGTGALLMFKNVSDDNLFVPSQGIDAESQPARARTTSLLATLLGIESPELQLVSYRGVPGSLQPLVPNSIDFSKLRKANRPLYERVIRSEAFARGPLRHLVARSGRREPRPPVPQHAADDPGARR